MTKSVLITGGAKRVGEHLTRAFAGAGWDVAIHCHSSTNNAQKLKAELAAQGRKAEVFVHDLADAGGLAEMVAQVKRAFPNLALLINNASIFERATLLETDEALFDRQFAINLKAPFFLTQAFAKQVAGGHIINILDTYVAQNEPSHFAYLLSKKALAECTAMAARELAPKFRVNGICPGMLLPTVEEKNTNYEKELTAKLPLKQIATLEQVSSAALMLENTPSITGQLLFLDGGQHLL